MTWPRHTGALALSIGLLAAGCRVEEVRNPRRPSAPVILELETESSRVTADLWEKGHASLCGRILVDDDLSPTDLRVTLWKVDPEDEKRRSGTPGTPERNGKFRIPGGPYGARRLAIRSRWTDEWGNPVPRPGGAPVLLGILECPVELDVGELRTVVVDLRPHRPVEARVRVRANGRPVAGLNVWWVDGSERVGWMGITDERGVVAGWYPPREGVTLHATSRAGPRLAGAVMPGNLVPETPIELDLEVEGGELTIAFPEGFSLGEGEQLRLRAMPSGVGFGDARETLIRTEETIAEDPRYADQVLEWRGPECDLGLVPPGELRIEAAVDQVAGSWPPVGIPVRVAKARRFRGEATVETGERTVCELRER